MERRTRLDPEEEATCLEIEGKEKGEKWMFEY